ncbi:MAG TPA: Crp/Fnr family transcriptional regulator [Chitinophagaceae bacterium]|jgi:CRP/FNR family transcriptional regulator|nr:Crp/Fnr family transcriptional regulator [Chitinophagaceae bacterium]
MTAEKKMLLIRNYDLWCHISDEEYEELNFVHRYIEAKKGDYIYFEAFNHNKLYFIKEGYIRIGYIDDEGREVIKEIIQQGELFGQFTLEKNNLNGEFAQAYKADVSLCAFNIDDFEKLLHRKPEIALKYTKQVGNKLRNVQNRVVNLLHKDVKTRLLGFFWQLLQLEAPADAKAPYCIPNYLTHEDIAHLVGSSRQTVTTIMNELAAEELLTYNRQQICFPDVKRLQKLVNVV